MNYLLLGASYSHFILVITIFHCINGIAEAQRGFAKENKMIDETWCFLSSSFYRKEALEMLSSATLQAAANRQQMLMSLLPFQVATASKHI